MTPTWAEQLPGADQEVRPVIREAARRVERDVKAVHGDVQVLLKAGMLEKTEKGQIVFPYDAVHVDFMLKAA